MALMLKTPGTVKNLIWISENPEERKYIYVPHLYLESKIDLSDVRTGFNETYNINRAMEIPSDISEPFWDDDVVWEINPGKLATTVPEERSFKDLPEYVDGKYLAWIETQFIQYLLRAFKIKVYRNYNLDVYSFSGESLNDFIIRCVDLHKGMMYSEFDSVHGIFKRQLERLQQKYLRVEGAEELENFKTESYNRELFHRISERISALFLRTEFSIQHVDPPSESASRIHEMEERLWELHRQARNAVIRILDSYEEKIKSIDEYILHPAMKDIHFVSSCILWMPEQPVA